MHKTFRMQNHEFELLKNQTTVLPPDLTDVSKPPASRLWTGPFRSRN